MEKALGNDGEYKKMLEIKINLREIRKQKGLTQKELARLSGVSVAYISMLELQKRSPTIFILVNLAKVLNVKVGDLVAVTEDNFRSTYKYF